MTNEQLDGLRTALLRSVLTLVHSRPPDPKHRSQHATRSVNELLEARAAGQLDTARGLVILDRTHRLVSLEIAAWAESRRSAGRAASAAGAARAATVDYDPSVVRAWARAHGVDCPERGRYLPAEVVDAWRAAG